jgi:hypothetical protein
VGVTETVPQVGQIQRRVQQPTAGQAAHVARSNRAPGGYKASALGSRPGGGLRGSATLAQGGQERVTLSPMRYLKCKNRLLWGGDLYLPLCNLIGMTGFEPAPPPVLCERQSHVVTSCLW